MKLFYSKGACSLAVRIIINEIGVPAQYESVDLKSKKINTGENFLEINDKGAVPVLELNDGQILTENAIILQYLADTYQATQLLPSLGNFSRFRVLEWVNYITTELHKTFANLFNPTLPEDIKKSIFIPMIQKKFQYINDHLKHDYLVSNTFTLPDGYLYVILRWAHGMKVDISAYKKLKDYFERVDKRESIIKSLAEENE
jgi:glutathione S-transferase